MQAIPSVPFDPTQWDYAKSRRNALPVSYKMVWQPGFLYNNGSINEMGGYTFILDADTGRVCKLNFGGWADRAQWSSDGRYLAIVRLVDYSFPIGSSDLTVLDTTTGKLYTIGVIPQGGEHYVHDFAWAPDNRHLLVLGSVPPSQDAGHGATLHHALYLVDFVSGQSDQILPEYKMFFADGAPMNNFAWSPDGSKLLIRCPYLADRICLISVQATRQ